MDTWLLKSVESDTDYRSLVKDYSVFKEVVPEPGDMDKIVKAMEKKGDPATSSRAKAKAKAKADAESVSPENKQIAKVATLVPFFEAVGWPQDKFCGEYNKIYSFMSKKESKLTRTERLSPDVGPRLLAHSGIHWTTTSQARGRDWTALALVVTHEIALIHAYRKSLIESCPGARALRKELADFFLAHVEPHHEQVGNSGINQVCHWEFPDNLKVDITPDASTCSFYDSEALMGKWEAAHALCINKNKKDPVAAWVKTIEKNKYLRCAGSDGEESDKLEALAHDLLTPLIEVCTLSTHRLFF